MELLEFANSRLLIDINSTDKLIIRDLVTEIESHFLITKEEAKALNFFLCLHNGLLKQNPEQYEQILRLINGLSTFLDK